MITGERKLVFDLSDPLSSRLFSKNTEDILSIRRLVSQNSKDKNYHMCSDEENSHSILSSKLFTKLVFKDHRVLIDSSFVQVVSVFQI